MTYVNWVSYLSTEGSVGNVLCELGFLFTDGEDPSVNSRPNENKISLSPPPFSVYPLPPKSPKPSAFQKIIVTTACVAPP